jgi:hypothetical protein
MRFIFNKFPDDDRFQPDEGWIPLKEASNLWLVQLQALPFMVLNVILMLFFMRIIGYKFELNTTTMLISFLVFLPIHEIIHALFFPESIFSKNVYLGFTFKGFAPFAAYTGEMKRQTFIRVLLAPLTIITLLGLSYLLVFGRNELIMHIVVFNALGASADCLGVFLILNQVPKYATLRNKQIKTYWKNK